MQVCNLGHVKCVLIDIEYDNSHRITYLFTTLYHTMRIKSQMHHLLHINEEALEVERY